MDESLLLLTYDHHPYTPQGDGLDYRILIPGFRRTPGRVGVILGSMYISVNHVIHSLTTPIVRPICTNLANIATNHYKII